MQKLYTTLCVFALLLSGLLGAVSFEDDLTNLDTYSERTVDIQIIDFGNSPILQESVSPQIRAASIDPLTQQQSPNTISTKDKEWRAEKSGISIDELDPPTFTNVPLNITVELGDLNGKFNKWKIDDANPDRYYIMLNDSTLFVAPTSYLPKTNIQPAVVGFDIGTYKFTIFANDTFGNKVNDTKYAFIVDTVAPTIISEPLDLIITEGNTTTLQWNITELDPTNYSIYINSNLQQVGNHSSSILINYTLSGTLIPGIHTLELHAEDGSHNTVISTVIITVVDPHFPDLVSSPIQTMYEFGNTGDTVSWMAGDANPDIYTLYRNGSIQSSSSWDNSTTMSDSLDGLALGVYNYTIVIGDISNNNIIDQVLITIADTTGPDLTSISPPGNITVTEQDDSLLLITWTPTDFHPDTYNITRDGALITLNAFWFSNNSIIQIVETSLEAGNYQYTLFAMDDFGNVANHSVFIFVIDNTVPNINSPGNVSFSEGTTGNTISWSATDTHPDSYQLYLNTILWKFGSWEGGSISFNLDDLTLSSNNLTMVFFDESENIAVDTVFVFLSDQPIFFNQPEDQQITNQTSGETINWVVTDSNPDYYNITRNGTLIIDGNWANGIPLQINIDNTTVAVYIYTIWLNDTDNNFISHSVIVVVTDVPQFGDVLFDTTIEEGSTNNNITWIATDLAAFEYTITSNITGSINVYETNSWNSGVNVVTYIDDLLKGFYLFTITIEDEMGNTNSTIIVIEVVDNILPGIVDGFTPPNVEYDDGSGGNEISWTAVENNPDTFIIYLDEVVVETDDYFNNSIITVDIDGLDIGTYIYKLSLIDTTGNVFNTTVTVTVNDVTDPILNQPQDLEFVEGASELLLIWSAEDENPTNYTIYRNNTGLLADFQISFNSYNSGQDIILDVSGLGLAIGVYNLTIVVRDISGNYATHTLIVEVTDIPEIISSPIDLVFDETELVRFLNWTALDTKPSDYLVTVSLNGTGDVQVLTSGSWENNTHVSIDISSLNVGVYEIIIIFDDLNGNSINDSRIIVIEDNTSPEFKSVPEETQTYFEGSSGNNVEWIVDDLNGDLYILRINGSIHELGMWESNESITINIDSLLLGFHIINFTAFDSSGNTISGLIELTVIDNSTPSINDHLNLTMIENSLGNVIVWISTEFHPDTYDLFLDNFKIVSDQIWQSGQQIIIPIDSLIKGEYNYTIIIYDTSGNSITDQLIVSVVDLTIPLVVEFSLQLIQYIEGSSNNLLQIIASDLYANNFTILLDGVIYQSGEWETNILQLIDINGLAKGVYNISLVVWDDSLNQVVETIFIEVSDITSSTILDSPDSVITLEENAEDKTLEWSVEDLYPNYYEVFLNSILLDTDTWQNESIIFVDLSHLLLGEYVIEITIYDQSNNIITDIIQISVIDLTAPYQITSSANENNEIIIITNTTGNFVLWEFYDNHPETYVAELDGIAFAQGIWNNNISIQIPIDGLVFGLYNITMIVKDTSNNLLTSFIIIKVNDPEIIRTQIPEILIRSEAKEGDLEYYRGEWLDENGTVINSGRIEIILRSSLDVTVQYLLDYNNGQWDLMLNYTSQLPGNYNWEIYFSSPGYQNQIISRSIEIVEHQVQITITPVSENIVQGSDFTILVTVDYIATPSGTTNWSLDQTGFNVTQRSGGVENEELLIIVKYIHINGDSQVLERAVLTDNLGRAIIVLEGEITINIDKLTGITASFSGSQFFESQDYVEEDVSIDSLPPNPNGLVALFQLVKDFIAGIILIFLLFVVSGVLLWYYSKERTKKINLILDNVSNDHDEITSLMEIQALILQNHGGIPIYLEESGNLGVDGILISGFSKAISSFLDEIERSVITGFETIQRDTFAINSFSTGLGRIILLANDAVPDIMKIRMIEIMTELERNYSKNLYDGLSLRPRDFLEIISNTNMKYTLLHNFTLNQRSIASALRLRSLSRTAKENFRYLLAHQNNNGNPPLTLKKLYNILRSRLIPPTLVTQIISVGYSLNIFAPIPKDKEI